MTLVQYFVASSIDGYIAAGDGSLDWLLQFEGFEGQQETYEGFLGEVGAIIMGADTYRFLLRQFSPGQFSAGHFAPDDAPAGAAPDAWPYAGTPVWVFSHGAMPAIAGAQLEFAAGDVAPVLRRATAAAAGRNVWLVGGGNLAAQFQQEGLLDELLLSIVPVILGAGRPLLPIGSATAPLTLRSQRTRGRGVVELAYGLRPAQGE